MASFLQSAQWEAFQKAAGFQTVRVSGALLIARPLPLGKRYWYCPRADVDVEAVAQQGDAVFLRVDPATMKPRTSFPVHAVADVQPSTTVVLDLAQSEDALLQAMHAKTRYNIRLAEKKGVTVRAAGADAFASFWQLMQETTNRDGFRGHGKRYYQAMVETCAEESSDMFVRLYLAEYDQQVLAAGIFAFYKGTVTYVHGASSNRHRNVMAPYALHWHVMRDAKQLGYTHYDLYGIHETKWPGVTRFKRGFGGQEVQLPGTHDIVFKRTWYSVYQLVRRVRRLAR